MSCTNGAMAPNTVFCSCQSRRFAAATPPCVRCSAGCDSLSATSRSGSANGSGRNTMPLKNVKNMVLMPMPSARVSTITPYPAGHLRRARNVDRISCSRPVMPRLPPPDRQGRDTRLARARSPASPGTIALAADVPSMFVCCRGVVIDRFKDSRIQRFKIVIGDCSRLPPIPDIRAAVPQRPDSRRVSFVSNPRTGDSGTRRVEKRRRTPASAGETFHAALPA